MVSNLYAFTAFFVGAGVATIIWFFVWRNNKNKFRTFLDKVDDLLIKYDDKDRVHAALMMLVHRHKEKHGK